MSKKYVRLNSVLSSNFYKLHHGKGKLYILYFQIHFKQVNILFNASSQISMTDFTTYCEYFKSVYYLFARKENKGSSKDYDACDNLRINSIKKQNL